MLHVDRRGALLQAAGPRQTRTLLWRPPVARCESASTDGSWRALPPPVRRPSSLRAVLWPPSCERWLAAPPALGFGFGFGFGLGLAKPKPNPKPNLTEGHYCGPEGHPWANEIRTALAEYGGVRGNGADAAAWLDALKKRALFWCAHALGGSPPFPPKPRPRLQDAAALKQRLPGHNK